MQILTIRNVCLALLMIMTFNALSQTPAKKGYLYRTITLEKLKKAVVIEDLLDDLPIGYVVVDFRISIAGKNLQKQEFTMEKNRLYNTFQAIQVGNRVFVEYIYVKKNGSDSKPVRVLPREFEIID